MADQLTTGNFLSQIPLNIPNVPILAAQMFIYATDVFDIDAGASVTKSINIEADADFLIMKTVANYSGNTTLTPNAGITVNIMDTGDGRNLNSAPVLLANYAGTASLPYVWTVPRRVRASSVLQLTFKNISGAKISGFQFAFSGPKLWYPSNAYGTMGGATNQP